MSESAKITFDDDGWPIYVPVLEPGDINESTRGDALAFHHAFCLVLGPSSVPGRPGVMCIMSDAMNRHAHRYPRVRMHEIWNQIWRLAGYTEPGPDIDVEIS